MAVLELFEFLLHNVLFAIVYMLQIMRLVVFWLISMGQSVFVSPQNLHKLKVLLYVYTDVSKYYLEFSLYIKICTRSVKLNICAAGDLVSSSTLQIFKFLSLELRKILILL